MPRFRVTGQLKMSMKKENKQISCGFFSLPKLLLQALSLPILKRINLQICVLEFKINAYI